VTPRGIGSRRPAPQLQVPLVARPRNHSSWAAKPLSPTVRLRASNATADARNQFYRPRSRCRVDAEGHRALSVASRAPRKAKPEHWSSINLIDRSQKLDKDVEYMVMQDYDRRNFYVHTGLTGVFNMSNENFEQLCMFALTLIGQCILKELKILGAELKLSQAIAGYEDAIGMLDKVQTFAFADRQDPADERRAAEVLHAQGPDVPPS
jgi:hypothetical protein